MEKVQKIKKIIKKAFSEVYEKYNEKISDYLILKKYKLIHIYTKELINQLGFAIATDDDGIIIEFSVSASSVFSASSKGDLLSSQYEVKDWLQFLCIVENELKK